MNDSELIARRLHEDARVAEALRAAGEDVQSVFDLVKTNRSYPGVLPTLSRLLPGISDAWIRDGIVRALTVKEARGGEIAARLIEWFPKEPDDQVRWAIGNALDVIADEVNVGDMLRLAAERRYGTARQMIIVALGRFRRRPEIGDVLIGLLQDEDVAGHAITALRKLRATRARAAVERFLGHPKTWIRNEAKKALAAFDKAEAHVTTARTAAGARRQPKR